MKTYTGSGRAKNPKKTKLLYTIVATVSVIVIALTVTLSIVLTRPNADVPVVTPPIDDNTGNVDPGNTDPITPPSTDVDGDTIKFGLPVANATVMRESSLTELVPMSGMWRSHNGVDFTAASGEEVKSIAKGTVINVQDTTLEGVVVSVDHGDGIVSYYKSLEKATVKTGDTVDLGSTIGVAGIMMTEMHDDVHVHLEMSVNGELVDPLSYVDAEINK